LKKRGAHRYTELVPQVISAASDLTSAEFVKRFRSAAKVFTTRATKTKKAAIATLVKEGIYTRKGTLTKEYR
jgi:hypothetical protein